MNIVIIPTYQERDTIRDTVDKVLTLGTEYRVIVVDDESTDGTKEVIDRLRAEHPDRVHVIHRPPPRSFAASYILGFEHALKQADCDVVIQCDADGSHPVSRIPDLVVALQQADVAIGSRYVPGGKIVGLSTKRRLLSWTANRYISFMTGLHIADITAGFSAYRAPFLRSLPYASVRSNGYAFLIEMKWLIRRAGAKVAEIPITLVDRTKGKSKMSFSTMVEAFLLGLRYRLRQQQ